MEHLGDSKSIVETMVSAASPQNLRLQLSAGTTQKLEAVLVLSVWGPPSIWACRLVVARGLWYMPCEHKGEQQG